MEASVTFRRFVYSIPSRRRLSLPPWSMSLQSLGLPLQKSRCQALVAVLMLEDSGYGDHARVQALEVQTRSPLQQCLQNQEQHEQNPSNFQHIAV